MEDMLKITKPNAQWNPIAAKIFNDICVEQVLANNRPQSCLNIKGYANLVTKFNEQTGRNYTRVQMKNRWDALESEFTTWKTLLLSASGLVLGRRQRRHPSLEAFAAVDWSDGDKTDGDTLRPYDIRRRPATRSSHRAASSSSEAHV
jgi:hypothetical protein